MDQAQVKAHFEKIGLILLDEVKIVKALARSARAMSARGGVAIELFIEPSCRRSSAGVPK